MIRAALALCFALLAPAALGQSFVQFDTNTNFSGTSVTATLGAGVTSGNDLIAIPAIFDDTETRTITGCTDSTSTALVETLQLDTWNSGQTEVGFFTLSNITDSPTSVTCSMSGAAGFIEILVVEVAGCDLSTVVQESTGVESSPSGDVVSHALPYTANAANDCAFAKMKFGAGHNRTMTGTGATSVAQDYTPQGEGYAYEFASGSGAQTLTFDLDTASPIATTGGGFVKSVYAAEAGAATVGSGLLDSKALQPTRLVR